MSGGFFNYDQNRIEHMVFYIGELIEKNGRAKTEEELRALTWIDDYEGYYKKYPEEKFHPRYSDEIIAEFKRGVVHLQNAYTYAQRIDRLVSGDDSEETFIQTLEEELNNIKR